MSQKVQLNKQKLKDEHFFKIFLGLVLAVFLALIATAIAFFYLKASIKVSILLGIMALLVTLWTNKALPMGVVSLLPIILFPSFGILETKQATANYANPIIFLFLGGFMIATATEKTGLHKVIAKTFLSRFPQTPKGVICALGFASIVLGSALSNSTVALLLLPVAMSISDDIFLRTRFLLTIAFAASISGITTPISSPPNLIYLGFLENIHMPSLSFTTWIFMMLPITLLMLFAMIKILSFNTEGKNLNLEAFTQIKSTKEQKRLLVFLCALLITLFINSPIKPFYNGLGLNENVVLLAFGLMMFLPKIGFLSWNDSKSIPYELIFLFGASFCIATAFSQVELSGAFEKFFLLFKDLPFVLFVFIASCCAIAATSFLSTTALIAIILPIINVATASFLDETHRMLVMLIITICASFSFMIPISTPPNAIVFAQGGIKTLDMMKFGSLLTLVGIVLVTLFGVWYWWLFIF
ncbi:SLC13 family permease [Campylobacter sp. MIT 97-5078]|uniref:SLC13 family permease n=1 Tax=Campylobacter sp. MIT 97-5078 TaxID=1548153 RepID=UPI000512E07A|nr:DASS family sodium-coupled anion symporter [Campylobacter sp. MIT 97-5078]KGI56638.1 anion transporter [Campylobacter sp. MIT 97-5078]TQR27148.1 anion transporter [Campylobacter sp. MIT 97-5078]